MHKTILHDGKEFDILVSNSEKETVVSINEVEHPIADLSQLGNRLSVTIGGINKKVIVASEKDDIFVFLDGRQYLFKNQEAGSVFNTGASSSAGNMITSPMPGTITKINCKEGDEVKKDDIIVIVEAMKMENPLRAASDGKIAKINRKEGDLVSAGEVIVELD